MSNTNIFNGVEGFSGFFEAFHGENVSITFARTNSAGSTTDVDQGFLARQYDATWQRAVSIDYVLNRTKPVAMVGAGNGTLSIVGLVGTAEGMQAILSSNELCTPLTAIIRGGATFTDCNNEGSSVANGQCIITLGNVIPTSVRITGNSQNQGIDLQSATVQFVFGSLKIGSAQAAQADATDNNRVNGITTGTL